MKPPFKIDFKKAGATIALVVEGLNREKYMRLAGLIETSLEEAYIQGGESMKEECLDITMGYAKDNRLSKAGLVEQICEVIKKR